VEAATPVITECINKDSISNCNTYYNDSEASAGCKGCDVGFKTKDSGMVNSKPNKTCEKNTSVPPSIPNCDTSVVIESEGISLPFCSKCKSGFINEGLDCTAWDGTGKIANCNINSRESGTISCSSCSDGYYEKGNTCESLGTFTGCTKLTSDNKCDDCDVGKSYYAIDVDDTKGQICQKQASILKFTVMTVLALLSFSSYQ
jgi:hypothetical protein